MLIKRINYYVDDNDPYGLLHNVSAYGNKVATAKALYWAAANLMPILPLSLILSASPDQMTIWMQQVRTSHPIFHVTTLQLKPYVFTDDYKEINVEQTCPYAGSQVKISINITAGTDHSNQPQVYLSNVHLYFHHPIDEADAVLILQNIPNDQLSSVEVEAVISADILIARTQPTATKARIRVEPGSGTPLSVADNHNVHPLRQDQPERPTRRLTR